MAPKTTAPATAAQESTPRQPILPVLISSPADVGRLEHELNQIDETLTQLGLRAPGTEVKMPKTSRLMDIMVDQNKLNLLREEDRKELKQFLGIVKEQAPYMHISFGADPSVMFMEKLMTWLRQEIHPFVLVTVGLQPNIGAGCIVRSTNKQFDFSLGKTFMQKRELLMAKLK
ncbi:MAG TPA: hypothetical protein VH234_04505 [Candidatus Saccharimonadales bacterium]|jgi:hypothetical protein|nr:hypothetical protein [Candidatus Saccharimonadales bacterium]